MTEAQRKKQNQQMLADTHQSVRPKMQAVLADMEAHGWRPLIVVAWRNPREQAVKFRTGKSKVRWGFHCMMQDGTPAALAADIVCAEKGWGAPEGFWLMLASSALTHGLTTGIFFGLSDAEERAVRKAIADKHWDAAPEIGWDPAHVETTALTIAQARAQSR